MKFVYSNSAANFSLFMYILSTADQN